MNKDQALEKIHNGVAKVIFRKADGTRRVMFSTLNHFLLPVVDEEQEDKPTRKPNPDVQVVYEITRDGNHWRSFKWESVISVDEVMYVHDS